MNVRLWLAARFLSHQAGHATAGSVDTRSFVRRLGLPAILSIVGLAIGVASLTVAMAVVTGFETTLRSALIDVFGDILVVKRGQETITLDRAKEKIKEIVPEMTGITPFITLEAIVVGKGKLNGVVIQGVDPATVENVLNLRSRVVKGEFSVKRNGDKPRALVGKALAKRFALDVGQTFRVVLPKPSSQDTAAFVSTIANFEVSGIVDFGKSDYDERTIVTSIDEARLIGGIQAPFTGIRVKIKDSSQAQSAADRLTKRLGPGWWIMDWTEGNRNFFKAIKYERMAIFFVIFIMVIAASFNVASNIFIGVLRRTSEISILRALGFSKRDVAALFRIQGLLFGVLGVVAGLLLGGVLGLAFLWAQDNLDLLPAEVYKINRIGVEFQFVDVAVIIGAAILICLLASLAPASRAAALDPVEGLRHE